VAGGACGSVGDICRCRAQSHYSPSDSWGRDIDLSATEFALLEALLERPGAILSRSQLEQRLYGWNEEVESNSVEVHVSKLRKKMALDEQPDRKCT
jgi:DNA-binding response OmpR family regulator